MYKYTVQCAFLSNINTEAFFEEQKNKPKLKKKLEGTAGDMAALQKLSFAQKVANYILSKVDSSNFAISDSTDSSVLFAIMVSPSPKRGLGVVDSFLAMVVQLMIWSL
jgi:3-dehydrosphinganine reductase